ncbi:hypothetical protein CWC12_20300 [Pseudoalteromonas ruthenica]|nr:hypothetical protein CWC12_20300 [Pseudoalteromonas ruthenica]
MLAKRHGDEVMAQYQDRHTQVAQAQADYQHQADLGHYELIYRFGDGLIDENDIEISEDSMTIPGFDKKVLLSKSNPYQDMF